MYISAFFEIKGNWVQHNMNLMEFMFESYKNV